MGNRLGYFVSRPQTIVVEPVKKAEDAAESSTVAETTAPADPETNRLFPQAGVDQLFTRVQPVILEEDESQVEKDEATTNESTVKVQPIPAETTPNTVQEPSTSSTSSSKKKKKRNQNKNDAEKK